MTAGAPRALDHVVVPVADLATAAEDWRQLGFEVSRRNRHPWGTENHVIQFPGAFIELIALAPDYQPLPPDHPAFPFAGHLAGQGGMVPAAGMLVLRSVDADGDAALFEARGIGSGRRLDFARTGTAPDGSLREVAFSLAFADAPAMPGLGFFTCQQRRPENFWSPAAQRHPNGVTALAGLDMATPGATGSASFLAAFADAPVSADPGGLRTTLAESVSLSVRDVVAPGGITGLAFRGPAAPTRQIGHVTLHIGP